MVESSASKSIVELAAQTGRLVRRLYGPVPAKLSRCDLGGTSLSAGHVLAICPYFGRIEGGRFTRLPGMGSPFFGAAW
ncbi:MAG: hypothetical protein ACM3ML_33750 [Micromonosporaceae bacterium]